MKKIMSLIFVLVLACACTSDNQEALVCTMEYDGSSRQNVYYYNNKNDVESVVVTMNQVLDKDIVEGRSKDDIVQDVSEAFVSTVGTSTEVSVEYTEDTRRVDVELLMDADDMNERELQYLKLGDSIDVHDVEKQWKKNKAGCTRVKR